ncbi:MAG: nucleotide pyrophosphohydrolase [Myxococcota bacterium]
MGGDLEELAREVVAFRDERDWRQFHSPRNLAAAISVEAAELLEIYQWQEPAGARARAAEEIADIAIYLLTLAHDLQIDLGDAVRDKLLKNAERYPADEVRGSAEKKPHK